MKLTLLILALIFPPMALGASDDDAVNERPPVTPADLELHWSVDCRDTWNALRASLDAGRCPLSDEGVHQLRLCTYIHQPPGKDHGATCPDYRGALERALDSGNCASLADFVSRQPQCPET